MHFVVLFGFSRGGEHRFDAEQDDCDDGGRGADEREGAEHDDLHDETADLAEEPQKREHKSAPRIVERLNAAHAGEHRSADAADDEEDGEQNVAGRLAAGDGVAAAENFAATRPEHGADKGEQDADDAEHEGDDVLLLPGRRRRGRERNAGEGRDELPLLLPLRLLRLGGVSAAL